VLIFKYGFYNTITETTGNIYIQDKCWTDVRQARYGDRIGCACIVTYLLFAFVKDTLAVLVVCSRSFCSGDESEPVFPGHGTADHQFRPGADLEQHSSPNDIALY